MTHHGSHRYIKHLVTYKNITNLVIRIVAIVYNYNDYETKREIMVLYNGINI